MPNLMKHHSKFCWAIAVLSMVVPVKLLAATVSLVASDGVGTTSFNAAGKWSDTQPPSAANDYVIDGYFMRTPTDSGNTIYTFAGHSLTLLHGNVRNIIVKSGNNDTFIINNLTNGAGGILENGGSGNVVSIFTGNLWTIAGNSGISANQGSIVIGYPLAGADGIMFTNAGGNAGGITYSNDNSAFKGIFYLSTVNFGNGGGATRVILSSANGAPGNPASFTPNQFMFDAGCTLQDNAGINFNNPNGGFTLLGGASIAAQSTTVIGEPITDNGGGYALTASGTGTLVLSNANNTYSGGTVISSGTLKVGMPGALPAGPITDNGALDVNGLNITVNSLSGTGTVDNYSSGAVVLTVGANNGGGSLTGSIASSVGGLSLTKIGSGTQTLGGGYTYGGTTMVAGGRLNIDTSTGNLPYGVAGDLVVSNGATLGVDASSATSLPAKNIVVGTNSTLDLTINGAANGVDAGGGLTLRDNATVRLGYVSLSANPSGIGINASGSVSAPGTNITIDVNAVGLQPGTFTLIKYTGTPLANLDNFKLTTTPGVFATLVNNTANDQIDLNVTAVSKQLTWYGANGANWNLTAVNWKDASMQDAAYQQYTNGNVIAGDGVLFDDTLTNDFVNPQPTNINITGIFSPYPITFNSTLPYSLSGPGGIAGSSSLVVSNTGSVTLLTSNSFTGGVFINGSTLIVTNDDALGAAGMAVTLNGGTLRFAGNTTGTRPITATVASSIGVASNMTAHVNGTVSGTGTLSKTGGGTLALTANNSIAGVLLVNGGTVAVDAGSLAFTGNPSYVGYLNNSGALTLSSGAALNSSGELRVGGSDTSGTGYDAYGTLNMSGGTANLSALTICRGNNNQNGVSGEVNISGGTMTSTNDVLVGFAGTGKGTLRISGTGTLNVGTTTTKWLRFGQWDSTSGEIDVSGGNLNLNQGTSIKFNQNNSSGPKTFNQDGGSVTFYSDFATTIGGGGNLDLMLTGTAAATNTYNLNGGTLTVPQVTSSGSSGTRIFNFNGGTLKPTASSATFFNLGSGSAVANVRNGGAVIDAGGFNITIAQPLVHSTIAGDNATDGGLTKNGGGTLTLSGANTYNGKTTVNAGSLLTTTSTGLSGGATVGDGATLSVVQVGNATETLGDLTLNGSGTTPGATLGVGLTAANDSAVPMLTCGTLTLSGNNTISLAGSVKVGTIALIKATGAIAGSGTITNLVLPQGAEGTISVDFSGGFTTVSAVITSTGPGLVWSGSDSVSPNLWDINMSTNWLLNVTPTTYQQTIIPGDAVTFNDSGSGTVLVNTTVGPASLMISNNSTAYTFRGNGNISGPANLEKMGTGTAILNLTNNSYTGDTLVEGGKLQLGVGSAIPASGKLVLGSTGTMELAGASLKVKELTGSGIVNNNSGVNPILTVGGSSGGTWNGTIQDSGAGGIALIKVGSGTWIVGGTNRLNDAQSFTDRNQINGGTVIITNGGVLSSSTLEFQIANGSGSTGAVVVAGGTLVVTNNVLSVGYGDAAANGTLTVNSGTVDHSGLAPGSFAAVANSIDVGAQGANGTLIVNGGRVLNDQPLYLGDGATANGALYLNGGVLQASVLQANATPVSSAAYFNGGTLLAATNAIDFISGVTANIMGNGLVLDDGGFTISLVSSPLVAGDSNNGGLVKTGSGSVYMDTFSSYAGTTVISNGFFAGVGGVTGPVVIKSAGNIGAGDATGIGVFNLSSDLTIQGKATLRITKDGGSPYADLINVSGTANYGGTLVITNITTDGTLLANGDSFQLFSASGGHSGNFASIAGSPGSGLAYQFDPASGMLSVVTSTIANNPTNITWSVSGNTLSLTWPADHLGWILQSQTNSLGAGLGNNWTDVPGSDAVTSKNVTIYPSDPSVFYRLRHP